MSRRHVHWRRMSGVLGAVLLAAPGVITPVSAAPKPATVYAVPGLRAPAELIVDNWGVPHLFARDTGDLFLAQGFNAARDRLFQIDLWHRRGLGRLAEVLGPSYVERDAAARLFLYRGDMRAEWDSYGPDGRLAATRFAAGINAYIDWVAVNPDALPEEFRKLGFTPSRWEPEDVVRIRSNGLIGNLANEVTRSRVTCVAGADADQIRVPLEPAHQARVPAGFDPCSLPADVLRTYQLATQPVVFTGTQVRTGLANEGSTEGSNNWTIGPSRTATGRPILANDPHRAYGAPSLRYITHLSAPGLDVLGAGEPSQPGISLGHNGTVAFGLTVFTTDQEDLYVYELDPADPARYRYGSGWERMTQVTERIAVAGAEERTVTLNFTRHGPVIHLDAGRHTAYAARTAWQQPGMAPYYGSLKLMRARNFTDFRKAMRNWGSPSENQVYADTHGTIGWVPGGLTPKRNGYDGLFPVPGDGRYEWTGFYTGDDLPHAKNPAQGFFATANQMNLPPAYQDKNLGFEWANPARFHRIQNILTANPRSTVTDSVQLQTDQLSLDAQRIVALLRHLPVPQLLKDWNGVVDSESAAAALYEVWRKRHLGPELVRTLVPTASGAFVRPDPAALVRVLEHPEAYFGENAKEKRDELLKRTVSAAYQEVSTLLGPDPTRWKWGNLQFTLFEHPLSPTLSAEDKARFNVGPFRRGGDETTVNASGFQSQDFRQTSGPSVRMVFDVGNWDGSRGINTPGESGNSGSPHYRDLADEWANGTTFPLLYSRAAVERNAEQRILLVPPRSR